MILTLAELQFPLRLAAAIPASPTEPRDLWLHFLIKAAEQEVKRLTNRNFQETAYTDAFLTAEPELKKVFLPDAPIKSITSIAEVDSWDTDGTPLSTTAIIAQDYRRDDARGTLYHEDCWPAGRDALQATFTVGYDATEIAADSGEMLTFKQLAISMIVQEYALTKETKRHLEANPEGGVYRFVLDARQLDWVDQLRLPRFS